MLSNRPTFRSTPKKDRSAHHTNNTGTAFRNPWPSAQAPTWGELLQSKFPLGIYPDLKKKHPSTKDIKVMTPDWGAFSLKSKGLEREECIVATALGHAGMITEMPLEGTGDENGSGKKSFYVVYDPIFSSRAGPTQYTGPGRMRPPPCTIEDLPGCDVVMISHNHYDHLDLSTISSILKKFPEALYFVPLGNKSWLSSVGIPKEKIFELDWWQHREYSIQDFGHVTAGNASQDTLLRFTCVPAQHNSGRAALDQGTTLWCGWVVEQLLVSKDEATSSQMVRKGAIYHAGDTGYRRTAKSTAICPIFVEIGQKFNGFDISFIPIWRGGSLGFLSYLGLRLSHKDIPAALHASPEDAVEIHREVASRNTVAVHFGTFVGSENESLEAVLEFEEGRERKGVLGLGEKGEEEKNGRAGILDIGGSLAVEIEVREVTS